MTGKSPWRTLYSIHRANLYQPLHPIRAVPPDISPLAVLLIFTGVQFVTMGLLAEIMSRTYHESQDKSTYVIREIRESAEPPRPRAII